jgi:hypothetical protein
MLGNGNIGIGQTAPTAKLDIHGSNAFDGSDNSPATLFVGRRADGALAAIGIGYDGSHIWHEEVSASGVFSFYYNGGGMDTAYGYYCGGKRRNKLYGPTEQIGCKRQLHSG